MLEKPKQVITNYLKKEKRNKEHCACKNALLCNSNAHIQANKNFLYSKKMCENDKLWCVEQFSPEHTF